MEEQITRKYCTVVASPKQAVVHLLFHCSGKDGEFHTRELNFIADAVVMLGGEREINLDRELELYLSYRRRIADENAYLLHLITTIGPKHKLALLWQCMQIMATDASVAFGEEVLLQKIAGLLNMRSESIALLYDLALQMNRAQVARAF